MVKPEISVIMSVHTETANGIKTAVDSILNQSFTNFEFLIVNDNPTNSETQKILSEISEQDNRILIITNDRNRGLGHSLNSAIRQSKADLVARMDTEDTSHTHRFSKQRKHLKAHSNVDLLFTQWIDVNEINEPAARRPSRNDFANIKSSFFTKSLLMHPTLMARKQVLIENPYPEMDRPEDIVLWLKLIRHNYTFSIIEELLYKYRVDRLNIEQRQAKIKAGSKNLIPHLIRESRYYWANISFWLYFARTLFEYLSSRNISIFKLTHSRAAQFWRIIFGP